MEEKIFQELFQFETYLRLLTRKHDAYLKQETLTSEQYEVLKLLYFSSVEKQSELVKETHLSKQSLSRALKKLQERGYVSKCHDVCDNRQYKINLTPAGRQFARQFVGDHENMKRMAFKQLNDFERGMLLKTLEAYLSELKD